MVVGTLLSYWEGNFSGAMLNFGRAKFDQQLCMPFMRPFVYRKTRNRGQTSMNMLPPFRPWEPRCWQQNVFFHHRVVGRGRKASGSTETLRKKHPNQRPYISASEMQNHLLNLPQIQVLKMRSGMTDNNESLCVQ